MIIFISWSGERSNKFARALKDWLPDVLQGIDPWMSEHDISAGSRWHQKLAEALDQTRFGILCITPENQQAPWLLFEAGALSKSLNQNSLVPVILGMMPSDLKSPLSQFQSVESTKEGIFKLLQALNATLSNQLTSERLNRIFERCWPDLHETLVSLAQPPSNTPTPPQRTERELLEEVLELTRSYALTSSESYFWNDEHGEIFIDLRPICGPKAPTVGIKVRENTTVSDFLDDVYFAINRHGRVKAYTYNILWVLRDQISGHTFNEMGTEYIRTKGAKRDERSISSCGINYGMKLVAHPLKNTKTQAP